MKVLQADESHLEMAVPLFEAYRRFFTQTPDLVGSTRFLQDQLKARDSVVFIAAGSAGAVGFLQLYPLFSLVC